MYFGCDLSISEYIKAFEKLGHSHDESVKLAKIAVQSITIDNRELKYWCNGLESYKMFKSVKLTQEEFITLYCNHCGSQRCEGIGTEWFDGCAFKEHLST